MLSLRWVLTKTWQIPATRAPIYRGASCCHVYMMIPFCEGKLGRAQHEQSCRDYSNGDGGIYCGRRPGLGTDAGRVRHGKVSAQTGKTGRNAYHQAEAENARAISNKAASLGPRPIILFETEIKTRPKGQPVRFQG